MMKWLVSDCSSSLMWLRCMTMQEVMPAQSRRCSIARIIFGSESAGKSGLFLLTAMLGQAID